MTKNDLTVTRPKTANFTQNQIELIKTSIMPAETTDDEFKIFLYQCERTGLDPFNRQIYPIKRWNADKDRNVISPETSIDGFRVIAERSGKYAGQGDPLWCGRTGMWRDVWLHTEFPAAAKITVFRTDWEKPITAIARWETYCKSKNNGEIFKTWKTMPDLMLSKCAEALALRKAFPHDLSGLYTGDEMGSVTEIEKVEVKESTPANNTQEQKSEEKSKNIPLVTKSQLDQLIKAMKKTGWNASDLAEVSNMLFGIIESTQLNQEAYKELLELVLVYTPQEGCEEALKKMNNESKAP